MKGGGYCWVFWTWVWKFHLIGFIGFIGFSDVLTRPNLSTTGPAIAVVEEPGLDHLYPQFFVLTLNLLFSSPIQPPGHPLKNRLKSFRTLLSGPLEPGCLQAGSASSYHQYPATQWIRMDFVQNSIGGKWNSMNVKLELVWISNLSSRQVCLVKKHSLLQTNFNVMRSHFREPPLCSLSSLGFEVSWTLTTSDDFCQHVKT